MTSRSVASYPHRVGDLEHRLAGDSGQRVARWRGQLAVLHDHHVEPGSLGHAVVGVHQDRRARTAVLGLEAGRGEVAPLVVLDGRVDGVSPCATHVPRDDRGCPEDLIGGRERPQVGDRVDVHLMGELGKVLLALAFSVPARDGQVDERLPKLRHADTPLGDLGQLLLGVARVEPQLPRAIEQPVEVVSEPEDVAVPHMCDGVGQVGVPEPGVEDRNPGVLCGHVLTLDPRDATGVRAGGVQLVVAVLDRRAGRGVLPDRRRVRRRRGCWRRGRRS